MPPDANAPALTRGRVADPLDDRAAVRHTRRRWPFVLLVLAAAVVSAVIYQRTRTSQTAASSAGRRPQNQNVPVGVSAASRQDVPVRISALGSVTPFNTVTVRPRVDGQLMQVGFQEGQFVRKGDLLAVIDPRPFQVQLEQAEGQLARDESMLANAKTQLARYQLLLSEDSIARSNVDDQAAVRRAARRRAEGRSRGHRQREAESHVYARHGTHQRACRPPPGGRRQHRLGGEPDRARRDHRSGADCRALHRARRHPPAGAAEDPRQGGSCRSTCSIEPG